MKLRTQLLWLALFSFLVCGLSGCATNRIASAAPTDPQVAASMQRTITVSYKYLLYLPKDYAQKDQWPLLLFLHGSGERGDDLKLVEKHGPPKLIAAGKDFPFIVVSPQCPKEQTWEPLKVATLLDDLVEKYKVDKDRICVTGLSMGGFGCWSLAALQPNRLAAIAPVCGGGDPDAAKHFPQLAIWIFHGGKDPAVPIERAQQMVFALQKANSTSYKFTIYPDAGHDSWTQTYDNPELYEWLLQQRRVAAPLATQK